MLYSEIRRESSNEDSLLFIFFLGGVIFMKGIGQILYDIERRVIIFKSLDNNVKTLGTIYDVLCNFPVDLQTKVVLRDQ